VLTGDSGKSIEETENITSSPIPPTAEEEDAQNHREGEGNNGELRARLTAAVRKRYGASMSAADIAAAVDAYLAYQDDVGQWRDSSGAPIENPPAAILVWLKNGRKAGKLSPRKPFTLCCACWHEQMECTCPATQRGPERMRAVSIAADLTGDSALRAAIEAAADVFDKLGDAKAREARARLAALPAAVSYSHRRNPMHVPEHRDIVF